MYFYFSFAKLFGNHDWECYPAWITRFAKKYGIRNKAVSGEKGSAADVCTMEVFRTEELTPHLASYAPRDIYNGDETALMYKTLPHRTYCFKEEHPEGFSKQRARVTIMQIVNMDGSDKRKLSVIGSAVNPQCFKQNNIKKDQLPVDYYASKAAWMTSEIHHEMMTKFNDDMKRQNRNILYVCDNASMHKRHTEYSNIKFLFLPARSTSVLQPLDAGIIRATKRRYKKKLAEKYLSAVDNKEAAQQMIKNFNVLQAVEMIAASWKEVPVEIIQNCFRKAYFRHVDMDPEEVEVDAEPQASSAAWNKVQQWLGAMPFDDYVAHDPPVPTRKPLSDEEIVHEVLTENNPPETDDGFDAQGALPVSSVIKTSVEFLSILEQQRFYFRSNNLDVGLIDQLEAQLMAVHHKLCTKQAQVNDYFKPGKFRYVSIY